jgi:hypothetical protein
MDVRGLEITFAFPDQAELYATKVGRASFVLRLG